MKITLFCCVVVWQMSHHISAHQVTKCSRFFEYSWMYERTWWHILGWPVVAF